MASYGIRCIHCQATEESDDLNEVLAWNREHERVCPNAPTATRPKEMDAADAAFLKRDENATWYAPQDRDAAVRWHWRGFQDGVKFAPRATPVSREELIKVIKVTLDGDHHPGIPELLADRVLELLAGNPGRES